MNGLGRRDARCLRERLGQGDGLLVLPAANREPDGQYLQRPFIPAHHLGAVGAVGVACLAEVVLSPFVGAPEEMNLGEGIEDGAGCFVKLDGAPDFKRSRQDLLGTFEVSDLDENLPKRGERHGEPVARSEGFTYCDAPFGESERLLVVVPQDGDVRLVVHDSREDIVGVDAHGQAFALPEGRGRLVEALRLCEQDRG